MSIGPIDNDQFREAADQYLQDLHCTLWGEKFSVWSDAGRQDAIDWLEKTVTGINDIVNETTDRTEPSAP